MTSKAESSARPRAWTRIVRITMPLFTSEKRWSAISWLSALLILMVMVTWLNVRNSYVNNYFMTAIQQRNGVGYRRMAFLYVVVFGASTLVAVFVKFCEERLGLLWRGWLTSHLLDKYLTGRAYHRLMGRSDIDNPDQRMTEDVKTFTTTTLSFLLMLLNATIAALAFSWVLWKISPMLLGVAVGYAILGSLLTMLVGRKLINLNNLQLKKEANFRYELIHVREYAESIALLKGERRQRARLRRRLLELVNNFRAIVGVNRNLGFFTILYNYLIQIIPILIIAPRFMRGEIEFGVVTQSAGAFATLVAAFSLIVTQFQQISSFAAVVNRLGTIWEALDESPSTETVGSLQIIHDDSRIAYEHLTLRTSKDEKILVQDLSIEVPLGRRLLILGPDGIGKSALARATAGIWPTGQGIILRPHSEQILFIPQRPYTALGTLRDQFFDADYQGKDADERLVAALCQVSFGQILDRVGGLDVERDWPNLLTVGEQQLLAIARVLVARPRFAFLDRATSALSLSRVRHVYQVLSDTPITYISVGDQPNLRDFHDAVLELQEDGHWTTGPARVPSLA